MRFLVEALDVKIKKVAPIDGVSIGQIDNKSTWRIDFKPEATPAQRRAAQGVVNGFDITVEQQKIKDKSDTKRALKDTLKADPTRKLSVQDLIDLELL